MSRVDVVVPCYRQGHFLRDCVASVLSQNDVEVRVLIIDDASPDDAAEIAGELSAADPRVEFRRHEVNQGHIATYNEGLDWLSGDYALFLDADDMPTPWAFARAARLMDAHPEVGMTCGPAIVTRDPSNQTYTPPDRFNYQVVNSAEWIRAFCSLGKNPLCTPTVIVRASLQKQLGGYLPELPHTADMEMWLRFALHAPVGLIHAHQGFYRIHESNMHKGYPGILDAIQRRAAFDRFFQDGEGRLADCDALRRLTYRRMAELALQDAHRALNRGEPAESGELAAFAWELSPELFPPGGAASRLLVPSDGGGGGGGSATAAARPSGSLEPASPAP